MRHGSQFAPRATQVLIRTDGGKLASASGQKSSSCRSLCSRWSFIQYHFDIEPRGMDASPPDQARATEQFLKSAPDHRRYMRIIMTRICGAVVAAHYISGISAISITSIHEPGIM